MSFVWSVYAGARSRNEAQNRPGPGRSLRTKGDERQCPHRSGEIAWSFMVLDDSRIVFGRDFDVDRFERNGQNADDNDQGDYFWNP